MNPADALEAVRQSLGQPKRRLSSANAVKVPKWINGKSPLIAIKRSQNLLLREGAVVWAALVQANSAIFEPGAPVVPGAVLYSDDPASFARPGAIARCARGLFAEKGTSDGDGREDWRRDLVAAITDEHIMVMKRRLPPEAAEGFVCTYTSVLFDPRHLPGGVLRASLFPVLRHDKTDAVVIVPYWHWPAGMLDGVDD